MNNRYISVLNTKYSSFEMQKIFSDDFKYQNWRKCRIALAESQMELWIDKISQEMINEMKKNYKNINYNIVKEKENEVKHDVIAHIYEFWEKCPKSKWIIHLGATSQFVKCNTDLIQIKEWIEITKNKLQKIKNNLIILAEKHKDLITLWFTHFQASQPTTIGKRFCLYLQDLLMDIEEIEKLEIPARWVKWTIWSQATFLDLFDWDNEKVKKLDKLVSKKLWFDKVFEIWSQTYTRKLDIKIINILSWIASTLYKFWNDIRLLSSQKIVDEPFSNNQVWSSAMVYKRNPIKSERLCSLCRKLIGLSNNFQNTYINQWLERTLDDSAIRRMDIPESFLLIDSILDLTYQIVNQNPKENNRPLTFYPEKIKELLDEEMQFMVTEKIIIDLVKKWHDRQVVHSILKKHSVSASIDIKQKWIKNNFFEKLDEDKNFPMKKDELNQYLSNYKQYIGSTIYQINDFLDSIK